MLGHEAEREQEAMERERPAGRHNGAEDRRSGQPFRTWARILEQLQPVLLAHGRVAQKDSGERREVALEQIVHGALPRREVIDHGQVDAWP